MVNYLTPRYPGFIYTCARGRHTRRVDSCVCLRVRAWVGH